MKLVWLVLLILCFKESQSEIKTHAKPGSRLYFLCGCASTTQYNKNIQIKCKAGQVIQMEPSGYLMRNSFVNSNNCNNLYYTTCKTTKFKSTIVSLQDRIAVYKKCSNENSCNIKIAGAQQGKRRLVNYPFYCHSVQSIHDLSEQVSESNNPILYFTGRKYKGNKIDCDCSASSTAPIRLEIFFFHLQPCTCSKVKFLSETHQLFGCSTNDTTLLRISYYIGTDLKLEIRGMEPDVEDVLFFRVWGSKLSVNCSGCRNSTDDGLSTPSNTAIDTTTRQPDTNPSTVDPTTTVNSTVDSHIPAASTDQTNSSATATFGGILAAVIIINIVGIALYCFLRRSRKQKKSRKTLTNEASRNDEQSQYNYIDITQDKHGSSYTNIKRKHSDVYYNESIPKTNVSKDRPNNQYDVLEVDTYSAPAYTRADACAKLPGKERRKQDDYDHTNDGSKSKPTSDDNYNHIDVKMAVTRDATLNNTTPYDDYNHIGDQNGLSKDKLKLVGVPQKKQERKQKNQVSGQENTTYVNVNLEPDETPSSTEDADTYNHLQN